MGLAGGFCGFSSGVLELGKEHGQTSLWGVLTVSHVSLSLIPRLLSARGGGSETQGEADSP